MSDASGRRFVLDQYGDMNTYYDGLNQPDGFGHGHYNHQTGYNRPPMNENPLGWAAIMDKNGPIGKSNVDVGGSPW